MASDTASLIRDALALDAEQRAIVANALLESLHPADSPNQVDEAWRAEAARRLTDAQSNEAALVDADDHYAHLRASLSG